jgi:hypothetical protein
MQTPTTSSYTLSTLSLSEMNTFNQSMVSLQSAQCIKHGNYQYLWVSVKVDTNVNNLYIFRKDNISNTKGYQHIANITSGNVTAFDIY